jgi:O-antigen ligase
MLTSNQSSSDRKINAWMSLAAIAIGIGSGFLAGDNPELLILGIIASALMLWFASNFVYCILGLIVLRSALDTFSDQGVPAAFGLALIGLVVAYVVYSLVTRQPVKTDWLFWFLLSWVLIQGLWLILMLTDNLGVDKSYLKDSLREWIRLLTFPSLYLIVMQLKDKILPERAITLLFLSLIAPFLVGLSQMLSGSARIDGTIGHPNNFATFTVLFLALSIWKFNNAHKNRYIWLTLPIIITFFLVGSKSLTGLAIFFIYAFFYFLPRFDPKYLLGGSILTLLAFLLFTSSDFGQTRLEELYMTPLLNPDYHWSSAMAVQLSDFGDANSFNWRISQWVFLLQAWQKHPWLGYGIDTSSIVSIFESHAHNDYIRSLVETGILGFLAFISLLMAQAVRLLQILRLSNHSSAQSNLARTLLAFLIAIMVGMLTGNVWIQTAPLFYWWTLLSIVGWDWPFQYEQEARLQKSDYLMASQTKKYT